MAVKRTKRLYLSPEEHKDLQTLAEKALRSLSGEMAYLIAKEYERVVLDGDAAEGEE